MTITDRRGRTVGGVDSSALPADPNSGLAIKQACLVATTANITLSGLQTIDGVSVTADARVLVKDQTTASQNGIYNASTGNWIRSVDWDGTHEIARGTIILVTTGTANSLKTYSIRTADPLTIGTTNVSIQELAPGPELAALGALSTFGLIVRTGVTAYTTRSITGPAAGITVTFGDGVSGDPTLALANDLAALEALASTGLAARTAANTWAQRTITPPAAGISVSNGDGVSGNPTIALANDLAAVEGLASTGIAVRSATDTWVQRSIAGTAAEITLTNGDGVSGNPTASLPAALTFTGKTVTGGTFDTITAKGTWAVSGTWTVPAMTWAGTVSGGGQQLNNVIIGTSTPLAGSFTTLAYSTTLTGTSANANALAVGRQGATNPALQVDASTATSATGIKIKSAAAAGGIAMSVITSGTNENFTLDAAGSGTITLGATSTGGITLARATAISAAATVTSTSASALAVGANGATNPSLQVDASIGSAATGVKITSGAAAGGVGIAAISSGTNEALFVDAKGSGAINIGSISTGSITLARALTYGGVTLTNNVTGTGKMVLDTNPTITLANATGLPLAGVVGLANYGLINHSLAVSASASALTISLKDNAGSDPSATSPVTGNFRNVTGTTGSWTQRSVTAALSLVISSGSTMGVTSSTAFRIWVVLFDDGGTMRLGAINCCDGSRIYPLIEGIPTSSTAEGGAGAADNAGTFYTGTAVTSKSFLIVGYVEWSASGLTAGTWTTTNVNFIQSFGSGIHKPGNVVQEIRTSTTTQTDTTSTTFVATNLSQAITPSSAANLIELNATGPTFSTSIVFAYLQFFRAGSALGIIFTTVNTAGNMIGGVSMTELDKPNTTSSTTYDVRLKSSSASTSSFPYTNSVAGAVMTLKEIMG